MAYSAGRTVVVQKVGQQVAKCAEQVALGAIYGFLDKIPTNQSSLWQFGAHFAGMAFYESVKWAGKTCYQSFVAIVWYLYIDLHIYVYVFFFCLSTLIHAI